MSTFSASFEIDIRHLHDLGVIDPMSARSLEIFTSGKLNSNERLYFSLWSSKLLSTIGFEPKKKLFTQGEEVSMAYFIISGQLLAIQGERIERLGPGSVICLAEGLAGLPSAKTVVTVNRVQARIIPLHKIDSFIPHLPKALRDTIFTNVMRTLDLKQPPNGMVMDEFTSVTYKAGERIFSAGDVADQLFFIQQGQIELLNEEGKVFTTLNTGESFGEQAFLSGGIRGASAQAVGKVICLKISSEQAREMMSGITPLFVPVFEALLLQLNMSNALREGIS
jgi:CRP-like cAMP-binding protein